MNEFLKEEILKINDKHIAKVRILSLIESALKSNEIDDKESIKNHLIEIQKIANKMELI